MLQIKLLGDFSLAHDDVQVTGINAARLQSLLAYLILHPHTPQSREHLAFLFWPDSAETQALNNLRKGLHHLRHQLPEADQFIHGDAKTVQWLPDSPFTLDVLEFERELDSARQSHALGDASAMRSHLASAVNLYKGDLLSSCYDDWIAPQREQLRDRFMAALAQLASLLEEQGDYATAIQFTNQLLRHDPLNEPAYRQLMQLHMLNGDSASALRVYHTCATTLQREFGVPPSELTREVYERLLQSDKQPALPVAPLLASTKLVGQEAHWKQLQHTWASALRGAPHCVVVSGEAGMGKTRLIEEFCAWAGQRDLAIAYTRAYAAEGALAFAPVAAWLRTQWN
jgi:DNA-binding SARP family transcriptional activator